MEGYLFKRGEVVKTWRVRYFVLRTGASPALVYYRAIESGEGPTQSWQLWGSTLHLAEPSGLKRFRFIFEDCEGQRTHLAAESAKDRQEWMTAIAAAGARSVFGAVPSTQGTAALVLTPTEQLHRQQHTPASSDAKPQSVDHVLSPGFIAHSGVKMQSLGSGLPAAAAVESTLTTPVPSAWTSRRSSADVKSARRGIQGAEPDPMLQLRRLQSARESLPRSPTGSVQGFFTPKRNAAFSQTAVTHRPSIFSAIKGALLGSAPPLSDTTSVVSEDSGDNSSTANAYNANLKPLKSARTKAPEKQMLDNAAAMLPAEAILEQFDRAQQYVMKHEVEFTPEQHEKLQVWVAAVQASKDKGITAGAVAAAAMFVLVVTRTNDEWASWSEHDNMFVSPENMITEVQRWPSRETLEDLKECLDYCSTSWVALYCRLGGAHLLLEALGVHQEFAQEGQAEAHDAVLATLQCMQALTSGRGGMDAAIAAPGFIAQMCMILDVHDQHCSRLVVEMLTKLCLYSADSYCAAVQTLLGHPSEPSPASVTPAVKSNTAARPPSGPPPPAPPPPGSRLQATSLSQGGKMVSTPPALSIPAVPGSPKATPAVAQSIQPPPPPPPPQKAAPAQPTMPASPGTTAVALPTPTAPCPHASLKLSPDSDSTHASALSSLDPLAGCRVGSPPALTSPPLSSSPAAQLLQPLESCSSLLAMMTEEALETDLCQHVVTLINRALDSPEGPHKGFPECLALRQRLVLALLNKGLMKVISDLQDLAQEPIYTDLEIMKATIKKLLSPQKATPPRKPAVPPPTAPPLPPRKTPPPPPPPGPKPKLAVAAPPSPKPHGGPKPTIKMKSFFWDKLPDNRIQGTFWEKHSPAYSAIKVVEVEDMFQAMQRSAANKPAAAAKQKLAVLDLKRATAVGIRMSRLRVPWRRIGHCIIKLDSGAFQTADDVRAVLQCLPTQDEANMLQSYVRAGGAFEGLSDAELFCLDLMQVPRVDNRLSTFLTRFEAQQQLAEARSSLLGHQKAHHELQNSPCLAAVLQHTLALGNFLNWGSRLGQAAGFRLRNLLKLQDTRSADGKSSLMKYLAAQLSQGHPPAVLLASEVPHVVGNALKVSVQEVTDSIEQVAAALDAVRQELRHSTSRVTLTLRAVLPGQGLSNSPAGSPQRPHSRRQSPSRAAADSSAELGHRAAPASHGAMSGTGPPTDVQTSCQTAAAAAVSDAESTPPAACCSSAQCCCKALPHCRAEQQDPAEHEGRPQQQCPCQLEAQQQLQDGPTGDQEIVVAELLSDNYQDVMAETLQETEVQVKSVRQLLGQCKESFNSLVKFFGDNPQALANDAAYWVDIITFVNRFTSCQRDVMKKLQEQEGVARRKLQRSQTEKPRVPTPMPSTPLTHRGVVHSPSAKPSAQSPDADISPPAMPQEQLQQPASSVHWVPVQSAPKSGQPSPQVKALLQHETDRQQLALQRPARLTPAQCGSPSAESIPQGQAQSQDEGVKEQWPAEFTQAQAQSLCVHLSPQMKEQQPVRLTHAQSESLCPESSPQVKTLPQQGSGRQQLAVRQVQQAHSEAVTAEPSQQVKAEHQHESNQQQLAVDLLQADEQAQLGSVPVSAQLSQPHKLQLPVSEQQSPPSEEQGDAVQQLPVSQHQPPPSEEQGDAVQQLPVSQHQPPPNEEENTALQQLQGPPPKQSSHSQLPANEPQQEQLVLLPQRSAADHQPLSPTRQQLKPDQQQSDVLQETAHPQALQTGQGQSQMPPPEMNHQQQPDAQLRYAEPQPCSEGQSEQLQLLSAGKQPQSESQNEQKSERKQRDPAQLERPCEQTQAQRTPGSGKKRRRKLAKQQQQQVQPQPDLTQPSLVPYGPAKQYVHHSMQAKQASSEDTSWVSPSHASSAMHAESQGSIAQAAVHAEAEADASIDIAELQLPVCMGTETAVNSGAEDMHPQLSTIHGIWKRIAEEQELQTCILYPHILPASPPSSLPSPAAMFDKHLDKQGQDLAVQIMDEKQIKSLVSAHTKDQTMAHAVGQNASCASAEPVASKLGLKPACLSSPTSPLNLDTCPQASGNAFEAGSDRAAAVSLQQLRASGRVTHDKLTSYRLLDEVEDFDSDA